MNCAKLFKTLYIVYAAKTDTFSVERPVMLLYINKYKPTKQNAPMKKGARSQLALHSYNNCLFVC